MHPDQVKVLVQSRNPHNSSKLWYQLQYGNEIGGSITPEVKIKGDVYLPITSWASGKMILEDVRLPYHMGIISLSVHDKHPSITKIGDFQLVRDLRVARGIYVSGLVRVEEHFYLKAKVIMGYELHVTGRDKTSGKVYKAIQKKKDTR